MQKNALVLAGGGARGSYQIGVWQALRDLSINIDIVTGTSVGALNAALVTMDDFDNAVEVWKNMKTTMIFDVDIDETLPAK
ncbi:MAG: patatin-like phospholipase family protein, partial [Oscillospiraceae bacterium]